MGRRTGPNGKKREMAPPFLSRCGPARGCWKKQQSVKHQKLTTSLKKEAADERRLTQIRQ